MENTKKTFVLDTNVILHDFKSIYNFQENDIVIPIVVLEELDQFKKGTSMINFQAREFMRELDRLTADHITKDGISLGSGKGDLYIEPGHKFTEVMETSFIENTPDHRILSVADYLQRTFVEKKVIIVSQDINLRMKAKSLGINAQDYKTGKVQNLDEIQKNIVVYDQVNDELVAKLYNHSSGIAVEEFEFARKPLANQYSILKGGSSSVLTHYDADKRLISRVDKQKAYGIGPRNAEQTFALDALLRPEIKLISLTGKAGTGKTLLALAAALQQRKDFQQILLARPIVSLSNRDLGFLPGDVKDKIEPYMQPLYDNLSVIKHQFSSSSSEFMKIEEMQRNEKLVITPLAYIRGRSLSNVFFIVDEAQNLTPHEIKTIITRAGEGTKMIFTGDIQQIDSPYLDEKSNGLTYLADKMRGQHVFAHMNLVKGERSFLADLAGDLL
jgi:PhoH-like ATPase